METALGLRRLITSYYGVVLVLALGVFVSADAFSGHEVLLPRVPRSASLAIMPHNMDSLAAIKPSPTLDMYLVCIDAEKDEVVAHADPSRPYAVIILRPSQPEEIREYVGYLSSRGYLGRIVESDCSR